nr:RNA polymerase-associated protein Rtf1 [Drosophila takahashii]
MTTAEPMDVDETSEVPEAAGFNRGYDERLLGDAEDHDRLPSPNESKLARERRASSKDFALKERSQTRRHNLDDQRAGGQKSRAFERLMSVRNNKLAKEKNSKDSVGQTEVIPKIKLKASEIYSDDSSTSSEVDDPQEAAGDEPCVTTREELSRAVITRKRLLDILDTPILKETAVGCFVRQNVGQCYSVYQIEDLLPSDQDYQVDGKRTNMIMSLKCGSERRTGRMDVVSNQPIESKEFFLWLAAHKRDNHLLPTLVDVAKKQRDLKKASEYSFTEADVEKMIQTKGTVGQKQRAAYKKVCLITERDMAVGMNDVEKVDRLEQEIREIDEQRSAQADNPREHRKQLPSSSHVAHVPTIYRHDSVAPSGRKRFIADRAPKSGVIELEQYMRRKYKKSAVVSRSRVADETEDWEPVNEIPIEEDQNNEVENEDEEDEVDLFKLNDFQIDLDLSGLVPLHELFPGTPHARFEGPWDVIMRDF